VTACLVSGRILFLDIRQDRYLALPADLKDAFIFWMRSPGEMPPESCRTILAELGIGERPDPRFPAECVVATAIPMDSAMLPKERIRPGELLLVGKAVIRAWMDVRSRPLAEILARRFAGRAGRYEHRTELDARIAIFRAARPLIPIRRVCLHDCLALADWLGASAKGVTLVLGVSASPFAAHCWLQVGGRAIDDHPESPSRYRPILALP
jgi:hypothetical protein